MQKDFCNNIGTKRTCRDCLLIVRFWGEADIYVTSPVLAILGEPDFVLASELELIARKG